MTYDTNNLVSHSSGSYDPLNESNKPYKRRKDRKDAHCKPTAVTPATWAEEIDGEYAESMPRSSQLRYERIKAERTLDSSDLSVEDKMVALDLLRATYQTNLAQALIAEGKGDGRGNTR